MRAAKTSKKKLIIYYLIIFIMIGGTVFLFMQNYLISSGKKLLNFAGWQIVAEQQTKMMPSGDLAATASSTSQISDSDQMTGVGIFSSEKFRALKENLLNSSAQEVLPGKRNPFQPNK